MNVDPKILGLIVVAIGVIVVIAVVAMQRRKAALRQRFGHEYDRRVREHGSERQAAAVLEQRAKRVEKFHVRRLDVASHGLWRMPADQISAQ